jgi:hypothetical protein
MGLRTGVQSGMRAQDLIYAENLVPHIPPKLPKCAEGTNLKKTTNVFGSGTFSITLTPPANGFAEFAIVADPYSPAFGWYAVNTNPAQPLLVPGGDGYFMSNSPTFVAAGTATNPVTTYGTTYQQLPYVRNIWEGLLTDYTMNDQYQITTLVTNQYTASVDPVPKGPYVCPGAGSIQVQATAAYTAQALIYPFGQATMPQVHGTESGTFANNDDMKMDAVVYANNPIFTLPPSTVVASNGTQGPPQPFGAQVAANMSPDVLQGAGNGAVKHYDIACTGPGIGRWFIPGSGVIPPTAAIQIAGPSTVAINDGTAYNGFCYGPQQLFSPGTPLAINPGSTVPGTFWTFADRSLVDDRAYTAGSTVNTALDVSTATRQALLPLFNRTGTYADNIARSIDGGMYVYATGGTVTLSIKYHRSYGFAPKPHGAIARMGVPPFKFHVPMPAAVMGQVGAGLTHESAAHNRVANAAVAAMQENTDIHPQVFKHAMNTAPHPINAASTTGLAPTHLQTADRATLPTDPISKLLEPVKSLEQTVGQLGDVAKKALGGGVKDVVKTVSSAVPMLSGLTDTAASLAGDFFGLF